MGFFETIASEGFRTLAGQGTGWLLFVLTIIGGLLLFRRMDTKHTALSVKCDAQVKAAEDAVKVQYEKRIAEFGEILAALNRSSTVQLTMQESIEARKEAFNQLVIGFANLVRDVEQNHGRWKERGDEIMRILSDIGRRLEEIQRRN